MTFLLIFGVWLGAAASAEAQERRRPNVLWISGDDHAPYVMGAYGNRVVCRPCKRARLRRWRRLSATRLSALSEQRDMTRMVRGMIATLHRQGWTDVQIAAHTGVSRSTLYRWQHPHRNMRHIQRPTFRQFAAAYVMIQGD